MFSTGNLLTRGNAMADKISYELQNSTLLIQRIQDLANKSAFYKRLLRRALLLIQEQEFSLQELLDKIPFTLKEDLRRGYPKGFLACPWEEITAYFESSGTSSGSINSSRTMSLKTVDDLIRDHKRRVPNFLRVDRGQVAVINLPYALTSSAHGFHQALQDSGAVIVSVDQGQALSSYSRTGDLLTSLDARILVTSNPFLLRDVYLYDSGIDLFEAPSLEHILVVGVPISQKTRLEIKERYGKNILPYYGLSEFGAVGVPASVDKMLVHEDFYIEIYNPNRPESLTGEIVIWDLYSQGSPLIRYQTGDVGEVSYQMVDGKIRCYLEVYGRLKEAIPDNEKYLFPVDFQDMLAGVPGVSSIHRITVEGDENIEITFDIQITEARLASSAKLEIEKRARELTKIPVLVVAHPWGSLFRDIYSQEQFRSTQMAKTMSFHDKRKGEWLVTY
jgi:phenylacetate-CoA ligase